MNHSRSITLIICLAAILAIASMLIAPSLLMPAVAQQEQTSFTTRQESSPPPATDPYPPPTTQTATSEPTTTTSTYLRPLVVVGGYDASVANIVPGISFILEVKLVNEGQETANNILATFASGDFFPTETGGVVTVESLSAGDKHKISQPLTANNDLWGKTVASQTVTINYTNPDGIGYQETFTITFPINWSLIVGQPTATPTPTITPTPMFRPQLVITAYETDPPTLEPGGPFTLKVTVQNLGQATAKQVTMILGGGTTSGESPSGTSPAPGGVSGGSGDLTNFAPLGSSNVQSLGDLPIGASLSAQQTLIVNVSTNPGAYPLKISFVYMDDKNNSFTDDQVITLLVYAPPKLEISFYRDPGPIMASQPNMLPIQVVNLGRKPVLLGNMEVTGEGADFSNNVILVGNLDAGNYFTLDATMTPYQAGPMNLVVTVNYTDDFNQLQKIVQTLPVEVIEAPVVEPGVEGGPEGSAAPGEGGLPLAPETTWQKFLRFLRGLVGLDSGQPTLEAPVEIPSPEGESVPVGPPLKGP